MLPTCLESNVLKSRGDFEKCFQEILEQRAVGFVQFSKIVPVNIGRKVRMGHTSTKLTHLVGKSFVVLSKIQRNEFDTRILHSNLEGRPRCDDDLAPLFSGGITGEILDDCGAGNPIASSHENDLSSHSEMDVISMPAKKQEEKGTVQL